MRKLLLTLFLIGFSVISSNTTIYADDYFDIEKISDGVIGVSYKADSRLKVKVTLGKESYTYDLNNLGEKEYFPLQMGNGNYKVSIYQNTTGSSYKLVASKKIELKLDDPNKVYLNSVQNINWGVNPKAVEKAVELTKDVESLDEKAEIIWNFVVKNNKYDYKKLATLPSTYLPVPDITLKEKTGICYDFSSLYAAMLRSEGIPAKLVKGYAPNFAKGYHAWNEIYDKEKDEWVVIDSTYDVQVYKTKVKFEMRKKAEEYKKVYEY